MVGSKVSEWLHSVIENNSMPVKKLDVLRFFLFNLEKFSNHNLLNSKRFEYLKDGLSNRRSKDLHSIQRLSKWILDLNFDS